MENPSRSSPWIRISVLTEDTSKAHLGDIGLFIYDFDSLYELIRLAVDPEYSEYHFRRFSLYRNGRPIAEQDQLRVTRLEMGSPLEIAGVIAVYAGAASAVVGTLWLLAQLIEKLSTARLEKEKLQLEIEKLKKDL